ncbi:Transcription elongation factor spt6 [Entophlyctis sp. JEL0112]|nr:Transcription elongation factor spt6 [Entophlyctis sp. JEL0112]
MSDVDRDDLDLDAGHDDDASASRVEQDEEGAVSQNGSEDEGDGDDTNVIEDDSSIEDSDEEMTEADRGFVVDDAEDGEGEEEDSDEDLEARRRRRREQRRLEKEERKRRREEEEDLDEDDFDLINENVYGRGLKRTEGRVGGRLKKKAAAEKTETSALSRSRSSGLDDMFREDEEAVTTGGNLGNATQDESADDSDEDADNEFVINDEDDEILGDETEFDRRERIALEKEKRKQERKKVKTFSGTYGISEEVWEEIQDLFENIDEYSYALHPKPRDSQKPDREEEIDEVRNDHMQKKPLKLTDIYEPSEIAERLMTDEDEVIRLKDIPERFQLRPEHPPLSEEDHQREVIHVDSLLISNVHSSHPLRVASSKSRQAAVSRILRFINEDSFEVPFIVSHRKDHITLVDPDGNFLGTMDRSDVWRVHDLDEQFHAIEAKRRTCKNLITDLRTSPELLQNPSVQEVLLHDTYIDEMLRSAKSLEDVNDVTTYLQLYYSDEIRKVEEAKGKRREMKRAVRRSEYEDAKRLGIANFVKLYNVDVRKFSESISFMRNMHAPEDLPQDPFDVAETFVVEKTAFSDVKRVIDGILQNSVSKCLTMRFKQAARMMLAHQIAADPTFRRFIRKVYETDGVVTVNPTERGKKDITPLHPYYKFKYLKEKPIFNFDKTEFILIHKAELEGLVEVKVQVDEESKLMEDAIKHITNDYTSEIAERWNDERRRCVEKASREILFPAVVRWFKETMAMKATEALADECRSMLEKKIDVQPYRRSRSRDDDYDEEDENMKTHARVMAISWGDGDIHSAAFAVCIDEHGRVLSTLKLLSLHMREQKSKDLDLILEALREHRIEVVVVGGTTLYTRRLIPDIVDTVRRMNDDNRRDDRDRRRYRHAELHIPEVSMVEDDVARLVMNSKRFAKEFPDFPPLARYCVSLARRVQDATAEFATLFNGDDEIKLLPVHPKQNLVPEDKLKRAFERAFINVVNANGVDVNDAAVLPHRSNVLQFVSGLGPRKAGFILGRINKTGGKLESRPDMVHKKMLGRVIFMNCASFIRIHKKHFRRRNANLDVLDNTRIHPEDYDIARKMAAGALDIDEVVEADDPSGHVAELMEDHPERLNNLMLDDFADELYRTSQELKRIALRDIKDEIISPYHDRRRPFASAGWAEIFTMLTGESEESLLGMQVSCVVLKVFERFLKCRLTSSGIDANLQNSVTPTQRRLQENETFQAVVTKVDVKEFRVELDAREEVVDGGKWLMDVAMRTRDRYYNLDKEADDKERKPIVPKAPAKPKRTRTVNHPYWKNCTYQEAIDSLTGPSVRNGSVVIRPSTKGNDHICITWKVEEGLFQHIDILETNKDNEWTLGKTLIIDKKKFDDLEEIIAMYIEPMAVHFAEAKKHVKYRKDSLDDTFKFLEREVATKKRSSYAVIPCDKSHCLLLAYKHIDKSPRHEYIAITPEGFKFRNVSYKRLDQLFDAFKRQEAQRMKDANNAKAKAAASTATNQQQGSRPHQIPSRTGGTIGQSVRPQIPTSIASGASGLGVRPGALPVRPGIVAAGAPMGFSQAPRPNQPVMMVAAQQPLRPAMPWGGVGVRPGSMPQQQAFGGSLPMGFRPPPTGGYGNGR